MPRNSGQSGNRSFGLAGQNGKGSASRITDIKAYRENFGEIVWSAKRPAVPQPLKTLRELEEEEHAWRLGL